MFDIDKYLDEMEIKDMKIDGDVLTRTKKRCDEEQRNACTEREIKRKKIKKAILIAVPAAAVVLLIGILAGALLFSSADANAVAYYTVDVNPSICVHVDSDGNVTGVVSQNEDAQAIVDKLKVEGKNVTDAIREIVAAIKDAGYFDEGQEYVLIGCFAADGTLLDNTITDLQAELEADFGDMIDLLIVSGSLEDMQLANQLKVSPGLLKLSQLAGGKVSGGDKVEDVLYEIKCTNEGNYCAPELSAEVTDKINLSWDEIDFEEMGYAGKVRYYIAAGETEEEAKSGEAPIVETLTFYTYAEQSLSYSIELDPGVTKYFALYAKYGDSLKCSNVVMATMPGEAEVTPSPSPEPTETPEPTPDPTEAPDPTTTPRPAHYVTGYVSGDKVKLTWSKETAENFKGYKVVASKNTPHPKYPDNGYMEYIETRSTTSISLYAGDTIHNGDTPKLEANTYYYFSITYLLKDGSKVVGNAVRLKVPPKEEEPGYDHPASTIEGNISGNNIVLEWSEVPGDNLQYYKVVASFTTNQPVYPRDGYIKYITCATETRFSFNTAYLKNELERQSKEYNPGHDCWFSVTVVYKDGTKVQGNAIPLPIPEEPPEEPYTSTDISASMNSTGTKVNFSWVAIEDDRLECYKVVGSLTDTSPSYPELDYLAAVDGTSCSLSVSKIMSDLGGEPGDTYYFAITAYYKNGTCKTGDADQLVLHVGTALTANLNGDNTAVDLNWGSVSGDPYFFAYQVLYEVDDVLNDTADMSDTSYSVEVTAGKTYNIWIRIHYDGGVYIISNKIEITVP